MTYVICLPGKAGQWRLCMEAYQDMLRTGFRADVYTYSSLIQACQCCDFRWRDASRFFDQMKAEGTLTLRLTSALYAASEVWFLVLERPVFDHWSLHVDIIKVI